MMMMYISSQIRKKRRKEQSYLIALSVSKNRNHGHKSLTPRNTRLVRSVDVCPLRAFIQGQSLFHSVCRALPFPFFKKSHLGQLEAIVTAHPSLCLCPLFSIPLLNNSHNRTS